MPVAKLSKCLGKAGKAFSEKEADLLQRIADEYIADGQTGIEAAKSAVNDMLEIYRGNVEAAEAVLPKGEAAEAPAEKSTNTYERLKAIQAQRETPAAVETPAVPEPVTVASLPAKESVTEEGPKVEPTPATDRKVSRLADRVQLRVQKAFLLDAVKQQIAGAPEELAINAEGQADLALPLRSDGTPAGFNAARENVQALGKKYGVDVGEKALARGRAKDGYSVEDEITNKIMLAHAEHVTVEVPGDGTFRIPHTKRHLTAFSERIRKAFGTGISPTTGASRMSSTESRPITPLATKVGPEQITDAVSLSQSSDETRYVLKDTVQVGSHTVATDGRRLSIAIGGAGKPVKQANADSKGTYPNYLQVLPKDRVKLTDKTITPIGTPQVTADASEVIKVLDRIEGLKDDKGVQTVILHDIGGKLGISFGRPDIGDYRSDGVTPEHEGTVGVDSDFLRDAMVQARKLGRNEVPVAFGKDDRDIIAFWVGKNAVTVIMPVRVEALSAPAEIDFDAKPEEAPAPKPSSVTYDANNPSILGTPVDTNAILPPNDELNDPEAAQVTARTLRQAARVASGGTGAVSANQSGAIPSLADQEEALKPWAEANGLMLDPVAFADEWRRQGKQGGAESQVYYDEASDRYVKRTALGFNSDWVSFFRRIMAHNRLFPDTAYLFHGFTPMDDTQPDGVHAKTLQAIISQPFVEGDLSSDEEIEAALKMRGFDSETSGVNGQYEDERFIVDDVLGDSPNVITDKDGVVRFIDPLIAVKPGVLLGTPAEGSEMVTIENIASRKLKPNHLYVWGNDWSGRDATPSMESIPYSGDPLAFWRNVGMDGFAAHVVMATDENGRPSKVISPNGKHMADFGTPEAEYIAGDVYAIDRALQKKITQAVDSGDIATAQSLLDARLATVTADISKTEGYIQRELDDDKRDRALLAGGKSVSDLDNRYDNTAKGKKDYFEQRRRRISAFTYRIEEYKKESEKWNRLIPRDVTLGTPPEPVRKNEPVPGQPGYRFRSHPDTLINAGLDAIRQVYKVQGNEATVAAAKAFIENVKDENAAIAATMDYANTMPGAVRAAVKALIEQRLNKRRFDPKATPEERAQAKRAFDRLVEIMAERGTALGQEVQAYDLVNKLTGEGALVAANRSIKQRQEKMVGEAGVKAVEQVSDAMKAENERAIDEATTDLDRALRAVKVGKSIWQRYRDSAVARWISSIENANSASPAELPPLLEFTNRLTREVQARIDDTLPKGEPRPQRTPAEIIREAVDNREKYREAWDAAREQLGTKYADRPDILEQLDEAMAGLMERPYSDKTVDRAIKEAHREMGLKVRDLARMHYRQADALGQTLAEKIAKEAGLKPEDAERLANLVKQRMVKLTAEAKKKALARLIEGKTGASRRIFGAADRVIELSNLGAMTSDEYFQAIARELKLPGLSETQAERLRDLADRAQSMPEGFQRDRVLTDLLTELHKVKGVGPLDVATAIYYAHILSGYTTQMVNAVSTALNTAADISVKVGRHPSTLGHALRGIRDGSRTGFVQAMSILDTGYSHRAFDDKLPEVSPVLELLAKDQERNVALRNYAKALRYISRAMRAMDAVFFQSANEAFQRITAARLAAEFEGGRLNWQERSQKVRELLAMSPAEFEAARNTAKAEGLTGFDYQMRVTELIHQRRAKELNEGGVAFGREATFNQEPRGYLGVAAKAIRDASVKFPPLRLFVPFTNIVSNVANASLNYSPVGVVRAVRGYGGELAPQAEERDALLIKGIAGTTGLIWLLAYGLGDGDDEDQTPWITGLGPQSTPARNQLRKTGWKPNTVKIGGAYVSYLETPLAIPLAIVGAYIDGLKYNGLGEKAAGERLARAIASVPETIVSMSFLRGLADFMDAARGRKSWGDIAGNVAAGITTPNIVRQVDRTIDPTIYETDGVMGTVAGQIPGIRQTFPKRLDVVGATIEGRPMERFGRAAVDDELWTTLAQKQSWIPEAGKETKLDKKRLTPEQYRAYVQQSGPAIEARLRANLPRLKLMTPEQADDFVQRVTREERAKVKPRLRAVPVFDVR